MSQFFTHDWLLPNYNSNIVILIIKSSEARKIDHYIPIALENFKFEIFTKVLADMFATIILRILGIFIEVLFKV